MLKSLTANSNTKDSIGSKMRLKRFAFLKDQFDKMPKPIRILDVGGTVNYWKDKDVLDNPDYHITLLNLKKTDVDYSNVDSVAGDATNLDQYVNGEFDMAFSNSVIEHLYTYENQVKMASEIMRVGKLFFVQTPNKYFPIEPHYVFPLFQFIPKKIGFSLLTKTKLSRGYKWDPYYAQQYIDEIRLISLTEMKELFPKSDIYYEKFSGFNKSFTAHNFPN